MKKVASESKNLRKLENSGKVEENKKTATSKRIDRSISFDLWLMARVRVSGYRKTGYPIDRVSSGGMTGDRMLA